MNRLEFENCLIGQLMEDGAKPEDARRWVFLATRVLDGNVDIDPHYAEALEQLLVRVRPGEYRAPVISLRRYGHITQFEESSSLRRFEQAPRLLARRSFRLMIAAALALVGVICGVRVAGAGFLPRYDNEIEAKRLDLTKGAQRRSVEFQQLPYLSRAGDVQRAINNGPPAPEPTEVPDTSTPTTPPKVPDPEPVRCPGIGEGQVTVSVTTSSGARCAGGA